jgi:hypothetical protein
MRVLDGVAPREESSAEPEGVSRLRFTMEIRPSKQPAHERASNPQ